MTILRLALGLAAATAAAVVYSNNRSRLQSGGSSGMGRSQPGMGSTPGTDRWDGGSSGQGLSEDRGGRDTDFSDLRGSSGMGSAGRTMSGSDPDALGFGSDDDSSGTGSAGGTLGRNTGAL